MPFVSRYTSTVIWTAADTTGKRTSTGCRHHASLASKQGGAGLSGWKLCYDITADANWLRFMLRAVQHQEV